MTTDLRALDIECAKLLGWTDGPCDGSIETKDDRSGWRCSACPKTGSYPESNHDHDKEPPYYSSDMNLAMELWEKLELDWMLTKDPTVWVFYTTRAGFISCPTPAEAIARAFVAVFKKEKTG